MNMTFKARLIAWLLVIWGISFFFLGTILGQSFYLFYVSILLNMLAFYVKRNFFSLTSFVFLGTLYPMLGPLVGMILLGKPVYSGWNIELQSNLDLTSRVLQICSFSIGIMTVVSFLSFNALEKNRKHVYFTSLSNYAIVFCILIVGFFLERSGTIINSTYTENLATNSSSGGLDAALAQLFILFVALGGLAATNRQRQIFLSLILVGLAIYFLLQARRSEVVGILFFLVLFLRLKLTVKSFLIFSIAIFFLMIVEFVRDTGLTSFSSSVITDDYSDAARIPGASNVFVTLPTMIQIVGDGMLTPLDRFSLYDWFPRLLPTFLYELIGASPSPLEGSIISGSPYGYIGGMYYLTIGYLNGGVVGAGFAGAVFVLLAMRLDQFLNSNNSNIYQKLFAFAFAMSVMRLLYYHPVGFLKMIIYIIVLIALFKLIAIHRRRITME